ncbi:zinc-binding dehydrogenase [Oryzihumus leptocrescens]|uniref:zinc-binding dehydrogenase n=1 Tax=Oryzihumus leptocrescens TaxID=297536 RepID=UPI003CCC8E70
MATVGGPDKVAAARALGATHVVDHRAEDFAEAVRALTGEGADVIVDPIGGEVTERGMSCLAPYGRLVICGHGRAGRGDPHHRPAPAQPCGAGLQHRLPAPHPAARAAPRGRGGPGARRPRRARGARGGTVPAGGGACRARPGRVAGRGRPGVPRPRLTPAPHRREGRPSGVPASRNLRDVPLGVTGGAGRGGEGERGPARHAVLHAER